jgi:acyl dehydratase
MATTFETPADLANAVGEQLGSSDWGEITQERIDRFAEATPSPASFRAESYR